MNNERPIDALWQLFQSSEKVRLLNVYKGLPITNDAEIRGVHRDSVTITSIKAQIVCMFLERETFLQHAALPTTIRAVVLEFHSGRLEVRLGNLAYASGTIGDRKQVRVQPLEPVFGYLQIRGTDRMMEAELADISQNGLALYVARHRFRPEMFRIGAEMNLQLCLPLSSNDLPRSNAALLDGGDPMDRFGRDSLRGIPGGGTTGTLGASDGPARSLYQRSPGNKVVVRAAVKNVLLDIPSDRFRVGMRIFPTAETLAVISAFISQRQAELVREVRSMYDMLNKFQR